MHYTTVYVVMDVLSFCLRHGSQYDGTGSHWTQTHITWLWILEMDDLYREILDEHLLTFDFLTEKIERLDQIEELASDETYCEKVKKLNCFIGIKTHTALSVIVGTGDFKRFGAVETVSLFRVAAGDSFICIHGNELPIVTAFM